MRRPVQDGAAGEAVVGAVAAAFGAAAREPSDEDLPGPERVAVGAQLGCAFNLPHPPIFAHLFDMRVRPQLPPVQHFNPTSRIVSAVR